MPTGVYERSKAHIKAFIKGGNTPNSIIKRSKSYRAKIDSKVDWDECWDLHTHYNWSTRQLAKAYGISKSAMFYRLKQIRLGLSAGENANNVKLN